LNGPRALDVDSVGNIWLALREGNSIYRIDRRSSLKVSRAAGNGSQGFTANSAPALQATLSGPKGITVAPNGWVIFADTESHSIRYFDPKKNTVELLAGTGKKGDGKDGDALACELARPHGVFADRDGFLWIGDSENHRVRRIKLP
jgi:streptogramin lyase